jgi:hypothetical protein
MSQPLYFNLVLRIITSCMECTVNMDLRIHYGEINTVYQTHCIHGCVGDVYCLRVEKRVRKWLV